MPIPTNVYDGWISDFVKVILEHGFTSEIDASTGNRYLINKEKYGELWIWQEFHGNGISLKVISEVKNLRSLEQINFINLSTRLGKVYLTEDEMYIHYVLTIPVGLIADWCIIEHIDDFIKEIEVIYSSIE